MKDPDKLNNTKASIGGAMGKWPYSLVMWTCRQERTGMTNTDVIEALKEESVDRLEGLEERAEEVGIGTAELKRHRYALDDSTVEAIQRTIRQVYDSMYGGDHGQFKQCPFEKDGSDMACHRCPLAGEAMERLNEHQYAKR